MVVSTMVVISFHHLFPGDFRLFKTEFKRPSQASRKPGERLAEQWTTSSRGQKTLLTMVDGLPTTIVDSPDQGSSFSTGIWATFPVLTTASTFYAPPGYWWRITFQRTSWEKVCAHDYIKDTLPSRKPTISRPFHSIQPDHPIAVMSPHRSSTHDKVIAILAEASISCRKAFSGAFPGSGFARGGYSTLTDTGRHG